MPCRISRLMIAAALFLPAGTAHAHLGHIGDLAGHSHWIGLGAVGLAGAIAVAAALLPTKKRAETDEQDDEEVSEGEAEEASA